jgi:hypothetical protein
MRFMLVITNQFPLPLDNLPQMVEGFASWWDHYRDKWESAGFFAGGGGGGGICNVSDAAELDRMMLEWPLSPYSHVDAYALVDVDTALDQWKAVAAASAQANQ